MKKRLGVILVVLLLSLSVSLSRIAFIMFSGNYKVAASYNSYCLTLDSLKPTLYDCNLNRINNNITSYIAVIRPNEKALSELPLIFSKAEIASVKAELKDGYPIVRKPDTISNSLNYISIESIIDDESCDDVFINAVKSNFSEEIGSKTVSFSVDALGRLLDGDNGTVSENNYNSKKGIILTLDSEIQSIAESCSASISKGAVVIMEVESGNLLAAVSKGNDYLNRVCLNYAVGSVFKLVVACCAIENGIDPSYTCEGSITVGDTTFSCRKGQAHSLQNIKTALANSCNCYFINLALELGADKLTETAKSMGFGEETYLEEKLCAAAGDFPDYDALRSKGQLALLGFGQGRLTTSPLHFCAVISAIANGGVYNAPNLILGNVDSNGGAYYNEQARGKRVFKASTAFMLTEYMRYVVSSGTGRAADYNNQSAGKTSTAQTGQFVNGVEQYNTWFAGFYPYSEPKYAIVVMCENGKSGAEDCCPVFHSIVEKLNK